MLPLLALTLLVQGTVEANPYDLAFRDIGPGVVVAYRPEPLRDPVAGNITIIFNDTDVVVVDGGAAPRSARQVVSEIRRRTDLPVSTLILTHGHEDHVLGIQVFDEAYPGLRVVTRRGTRDYLAPEGPVARRVASLPARLTELQASAREVVRQVGERGGDPALIRHLERQAADLEAVAAEREQVGLRQPDEVFEGRLVLYRGDRRIELLDLGPGKAGSSTVVHLPVEGIVVAGDVVVAPIPYGFARDPQGWIRTLEALDSLSFRSLVPGHGEVLEGRAYLRRVTDLARFVVAGVERGLARGLDAGGIIDDLDWEPWMREFAGDDPVRRYYFRRWFIEPEVGRTVEALRPTGAG